MMSRQDRMRLIKAILIGRYVEVFPYPKIDTLICYEVLATGVCLKHIDLSDEDFDWTKTYPSRKAALKSLWPILI